MAKGIYTSYTFVLFLVLHCFPCFPCYSTQLQSQSFQTLLRIRELLNFPAVLSIWNENTDFCDTNPSPNLRVICFEGSITELHIIGNNGTSPLPLNFLIDSFFTSLISLPSLKALSLVSLGLWGPLSGKINRLSSLEVLDISSNFLSGMIPQEISSMKKLKTLVLDNNKLTGGVPDSFGVLPVLAVLSVRNNALSEPLPNSLGKIENLRVLNLGINQLYGQVPDLSSLRYLQVLDLEGNQLGPLFPRLGSNLVTLVLKNNRFSSGIPSQVSFYDQLQRLDISFNKFMGPFPPSLLSLPSITYLNVAENKLSGLLTEKMSCNAELIFVDLSSNLLTGSLPNSLLSNSKKRVVLYARNCLNSGNQNQHPSSFCQNEALAMGKLPNKQKKPQKASLVIIALGIFGGILGGVLLVGLIFMARGRLKKVKKVKKVNKVPPTTSIAVNNASIGCNSKLLFDARYVSQTTKQGTLGLPAYRSFSLEELEEATHNFDPSTFMSEGSLGRIYRGRLSDDSLIAIVCLKLKKRYSTQHFMQDIEPISKLRHPHLVSALGHCFECYPDDSSVRRRFLVFEYVSNWTLRSYLSGQTFTWTQRIGAAIGIAKGMQFLYMEILPSVFTYNLRITDVLLDQNLVAKICPYNLPLLTEHLGKADNEISSCGAKEVGVSGSLNPGDKVDVYDFITPCSSKRGDKVDVYDLGVILMEIIVGRPITSSEEIDDLKDQLYDSIATDDVGRRSVIDREVRNTCSYESLKTASQICVRCLCREPADRPTIDDVVWNLQFAAQVQDSRKGDSQ